MLLDNFSPMTAAAPPNCFGGLYGGKDQHGRAARGVVGGDGALSVGQPGGEGADSRQAVRDDGLASQACGARTPARATVGPDTVEAARERKRRYGTTIKDAVTALWEASDRVCGKRLKVTIPTLLPALKQHGRLRLGQADRDFVLVISAATIDRLLVDVKIAASGGRRRRAGFYSAIRR